MTTVSYERMTTYDWARFRELRLAMLADTPIAYLETLTDAVGMTDATWQGGAASLAAGGAFFARVAGQDVGFIATTVDGSPNALVHAMYVAPPFRGTPFRIASAMLDLAHGWATHEAGLSGTRLWVREDNRRARHCYMKAGYVPTGDTRPYKFDGSFTELELRRGA